MFIAMFCVSDYWLCFIACYRQCLRLCRFCHCLVWRRWLVERLNQAASCQLLAIQPAACHLLALAARQRHLSRRQPLKSCLCGSRQRRLKERWVEVTGRWVREG